MKKKYGKLQQLKEFAKSYQNEPRGNNAKNILKNKEGIAKATEGSCIRPDIYLDNDRNCEGCPYFDSCGCAIKRLDNKKRK